MAFQSYRIKVFCFFFSKKKPSFVALMLGQPGDGVPRGNVENGKLVGMIADISEVAVLLGEQRSLVGIVTRPGTPPPPGDPAIVILNAGVIHRVGHHRMAVTMSRTLARAGYLTLRFDFSGIGDSEPSSDKLSPVESCLADIKHTLDWLEQNSEVSRIILVGLCSGADHAILSGHTDARVVALVLMDPSFPATARYYLHSIARQLMRLRNWSKLLTGRSRLVKMWVEQLLCSVLPKWRSRPITIGNIQFHAYLEQCYKSSVEHGIQMLAVLTEDTTRQTYREQMIDAFPNVSFGTKLRLEWLPGSDHTFMREVDRSRLNRLILEWLESQKYHDRSTSS